MVIVLPAQLAVTPDGKPVDDPMPVAPVVAMVIFGLIAVLMQSVGDVEATPAVLFALTVIVPVALTLLHPPVNGML